MGAASIVCVSAMGWASARLMLARRLRCGIVFLDDSEHHAIAELFFRREETSMASVTGGCACGAVRYECTADPIMAANCYCTDCRHSTGTQMASVMLVPKAALKVTGAMKEHESTGDSGGKVSRAFCPNCGSPILSNITVMPDAVALKAGSLDDPSIFKPMAQVYAKSAPPWATFHDSLPKFDKQPG